MPSYFAPTDSQANPIFDPDARYWIEQLKLEPHPEGGYYRETYRATETFAAAALPSKFPGNRSFCTAIVYLLEANDFSAFHRIRSDETWHFYGGDPLEVHVLAEGRHRCVTLGRQPHHQQQLQWTVQANTWFASRPQRGGRYSLVGCTVSPGFDFEDFEMATAAQLTREFPQHTQLIREMTRQ
jgi:predicted cupin superfamily sugar epimerase